MADKKNTAPTLEQLENEYKRERRRKSYGNALRSTIFTLLVVAAVAVLAVVLFLPVLRISGASMSPNLTNGNVVVAVTTKNYKTGDIAAFYYNNNLMVKRVIGVGGDVINIDEDGVVYVNGEMLRENYLTEKSLLPSTIEYPYTVPEGTYFVMGDNRYMSNDSRIESIGCIDKSLMTGKIILRVWPMKEFKVFK